MNATDADFLQALGIVVVSAALLGLVGRRLRMPSIVAYLLAGLLIGPVAGLVETRPDPHGALATLAELGIVLLMFLVGVELSLPRIRQVGKVALAAGVGQVVFTAAGGVLLARVLNFTWMESIFISTALTFSSTVVVVKLLDQKGELQTLYGRIAVGIFLVQDLVVIIILTFLAGLGRPETLTPGALAASLLEAFVGMLVLLLIAWLASRRFLPRALGWAANAHRMLFVWSLAWCFGFVLAARLLGLSMEIGAFVAGVSVAQLREAEDLRRRLHPLMTFFVAVFFVSLGARMQLADALAYGWEAAALSLFVLMGNPIIFMWIIARFGYSQRTSFLTSVTVAQISEFSFIFAAMGVSMGLIGPGVLSLVAVIGIVTIAVSAYMILYSQALYERVRAWGLLGIFRAGRHEDEEPPVQARRGHVVVVGMNAVGRLVASKLHGLGASVLAVDIRPDRCKGLRCDTLVGDIDAPATIEEAGLAHAAMAISTLRSEVVAKLFVYRCRMMDVPVAAYGFDDATAEELRRVEPDRLIASKAESGAKLMQELRRVGALDS